MAAFVDNYDHGNGCQCDNCDCLTIPDRISRNPASPTQAVVYPRSPRMKHDDIAMVDVGMVGFVFIMVLVQSWLWLFLLVFGPFAVHMAFGHYALYLHRRGERARLDQLQEIRARPLTGIVHTNDVEHLLTLPGCFHIFQIPYFDDVVKRKEKHLSKNIALEAMFRTDGAGQQFILFEFRDETDYVVFRLSR